MKKTRKKQGHALAVHISVSYWSRQKHQFCKGFQWIIPQIVKKHYVFYVLYG